MVYRVNVLKLRADLIIKLFALGAVVSSFMVIYHKQSMTHNQEATSINSRVQVLVNMPQKHMANNKDLHLQLQVPVDMPQFDAPSVILDTSQACIHPALDTNDPDMMRFYRKKTKLVCWGDTNWVEVHNGTLLFSHQAVSDQVGFKCDYYPLIRGPGDDNISYGEPIPNVEHGTPLVSDFFQINCLSNVRGTRYTNIQAGVHHNRTIKRRLQETKPPKDGLGLSIAFLGFDSMSRMSWLRRMPLTRKYMVETLKAIELESYNIVGDGTPAALLPILTGKHETELPEARRSANHSKSVDQFPWLWKDFQKHGYVTSWADAEVEIAPFNFRLKGFEHAPTDYFMRPFYLAVDHTHRSSSRYCHGSLPKHVVWLNWFRDIMYMYKRDPKFMVHFYTPLSHDDNNLITMADEDLQTMLEHLEDNGYLNNTLLVIMADHGARFADVRRTLSGKLEERMPYVSFRFPPWFEDQYPDIVQNVRTNAHRLTTPFDIHETFKEVLKFTGGGVGNVKNRGISLFKEIPKSRTCAHGDVAPHWCACLSWHGVSPNSDIGKRILQTAIDNINSFTAPYRSDCVELTIGQVTAVSKHMLREEVLRFSETTGDRGDKPVMSDTLVHPYKAIYQVTFFTEPGHGEFEITLEHLVNVDQITLNPKAISRINKYGTDPACILDKNREIRQFCYCNNNRISKSR